MGTKGACRPGVSKLLGVSWVVPRGPFQLHYAGVLLLAASDAATSMLCRSLPRCVWWPWPRDSRQWKRPAREEARQAISKAVRGWWQPGWAPALPARWVFVTSGLPCVQKCPLPAPPPADQCPNQVVWKPLCNWVWCSGVHSLLLGSKSLEML